MTQTLYDAAGRVLVSIDARVPAGPANATETVYDDQGRVVETRRWANVVIDFTDLNDQGGLVVGLKVPVDSVAANAWDGTGDPPALAWRIDTNGNGQFDATDAIPLIDSSDHLATSRSEYDFAGRLKYSYTPHETLGEQTTEFVYDQAGRQTMTIDTLGNQTETHYNANRRDWVKDARNNVTSFTYDSLGRTIQTTHPPTLVAEGGAVPVATYTYLGYDGLGRKQWQSEPTTQTDPNVLGDADGLRWFDYDPAGRLIRVTLPKANNPQGGPDEWVKNNYDYDIFGNLISIIDPNGKETAFTYNHLHRQTSRALPNGLTEYKEYDSLGRLIKHTDFNGQVAGYEYALGRLHFKRYYTNETTYQANTPTDTY
ncbi:MAG: RHS repeat protein, partial [Planctomycetes bacterium]|nr:RHS repeat protein [Planctomycetota bacterium]